MTKRKGVPYSEDNPDHVPNPLYQNGEVDTTGTAGDLAGNIDSISPIFAQARADALGVAVDELADGNTDHVVLPDSATEDDRSAKDVHKDLRAAAKDAEQDAKDAAANKPSESRSEASEANKNADTGNSGTGAARKTAAKTSDK